MEGRLDTAPENLAELEREVARLVDYLAEAAGLDHVEWRDGTG